MSCSCLVFFFNPASSLASSQHIFIISLSLISYIPCYIHRWILIMTPPRISVLTPKPHSFHFYKRTSLTFTAIAVICNLTSTNNNYTTLQIRAWSCCCALCFCCYGFSAWNFCCCALRFCGGWFRVFAAFVFCWTCGRLCLIQVI